MIALFLIALLSSSRAAADYNSVAALVHQWAPRVWMHAEEQFYPYNVSDYLTKVTPTLVNCSTCRFPSDTLPTGMTSANYYLITKEDRDGLLNNGTSFLYGTNPASGSSALHAFVKSCDPAYRHFVVTYWFMYAFDEGKTVLNLGKLANLPIFEEINKYTGKAIGSHVGDLERMALEIKDGEPVSLFLSVHSIGVYYDYDSSSGNFKLNYSKSKGLVEVVDPPKTLELNGSHPVIYSAKGSHGVWAAAGTHAYTKLRIIRLLTDECSEGVAWDTWYNLHIHYLSEPSTVPDWFEYLGLWGNPGGDCLTIPILDADICEFGDGPPPLGNRGPDIPCT